MESKSLFFADFVVILQAILPYDLFGTYYTQFCISFRDRHDSRIEVTEFVTFLDSTTWNRAERQSVFARLVGQLAMRVVGAYDQLDYDLRRA
jgi:hypothetical protein